MRIGLLGGAFNPPHNGHLMIAQQVLDFTNTDEVWFLPSYRQLPPKPVESVRHRVAMTRFLDLPCTQVSTLEIDHKLDGDTVNLLPHLPKEHEFRFIVGSDQLSALHLWGRWQELLENMEFFVFPRYGYPSEPLYPNMKVVSHEFLVSSNMSSTKIRKRIAAGYSVDEFVPRKIARYIQKNKLYLPK